MYFFVIFTGNALCSHTFELDFVENFPTFKTLCHIRQERNVTPSLYINFARVWIGSFRCNRLHKLWRF